MIQLIYPVGRLYTKLYPFQDSMRRNTSVSRPIPYVYGIMLNKAKREKS